MQIAFSVSTRGVALPALSARRGAVHTRRAPLIRAEDSKVTREYSEGDDKVTIPGQDKKALDAKPVREWVP
jgi:hypothetical protein